MRLLFWIIALPCVTFRLHHPLLLVTSFSSPSEKPMPLKLSDCQTNVADALKAIADAAHLLGDGECQISGSVRVSDREHIKTLMARYRLRVEDFFCVLLDTIEAPKTVEVDDLDEVQQALITRAEANECALEVAL